MVCMADDLKEWKDFPKGLRVLLLDRDSRSATEIRSNLEEMEYLVHSYCDEKEALSAILSTPGSFHVAIVEVCAGNYEESFKFLETAKDLPIIMTSNIHCLSTMMKCIALGAVEFLLKPLSEDKLRNIWQHVLHKAFSNSPKPVEESVASLLQLQLENENENEISEDMEYLSWFQDNEHEQPVASDKLPAPATPQLDQGARLLDSQESQDQMNCSMETECMEKDGQSKFVETTSIYLVGESPLQEGQPRSPGKTTVEEDKNFVVDSKGESNIDHDFHNKTSVKNIYAAAENSIKGSDANHSAGFKADRKKMKVDWTPELHRKFVLAVEQLGIDYAIPSKILELMKVEGLTRHNVASHLQKYRIQKKHVIHREEDPRWLHPRGLMQTNHLKPIMAYPPYHSNCGMSMSSVYPTWRQTIGHPANVQMWGPHAYHHWQQPQIQHRNTYTEVRADAWGCPVMMPSHSPYLSYPQHISASHNMQTFTNSNGMPHNSFDLQPDEEMIDKVVKEAMSMPWSPLPLGLKSPSTEGVLSELSRQGISTIPPHTNSSKPP